VKFTFKKETGVSIKEGWKSTAFWFTGRKKSTTTGVRRREQKMTKKKVR
jgi:hypothetical protein